MVARKCLFRATVVWFSSRGTPRLLISASLWLDLTFFSRFHSRLPAEMPIWECFLDFYARLPRCEAQLTCFPRFHSRLPTEMPIRECFRPIRSQNTVRDTKMAGFGAARAGYFAPCAKYEKANRPQGIRGRLSPRRKRFGGRHGPPVKKSDSDAIRTRDPQLRRLLLYPAELRNHQKSARRPK